MKNPELEISNNWKVIRDEFHQIDPISTQFSKEENEKNLFFQEDLLLLRNENYQIDLGWYGGNENGCFHLYVFRGEDWYSCELLEKVKTEEYKFVIRVLNNIARNH